MCDLMRSVPCPAGEEASRCQNFMEHPVDHIELSTQFANLLMARMGRVIMRLGMSLDGIISEIWVKCGIVKIYALIWTMHSESCGANPPRIGTGNG
jgi:hypothetical protein